MRISRENFCPNGTRASVRPLVRAIASLGFGAALMSLGACTILVTPPDRPTAAKRAQGLTYVESLTYLDAARQALQDGLNKVEGLDSATKGATGIGVMGTGISAMFKGSPGTTLGLLSLAGLGYTTGQTSQPLSQAAIYRAGLRNLQCIEENAGSLAARSTHARAELTDLRGALTLAMSHVLTETRSARADTEHAQELSVQVKSAESAYAATAALGSRIDSFLDATDVGRAVYLSASKTVESVNDQLEAKAPSLDAISESGSVLKTFVATQQTALAQAKASAAATTAAKTSTSRTTEGAAATRLQTLGSALDELSSVVTSIQVILDLQTSMGPSVSSCQTVMPGDEPLILLGSDSATLTPGGEAFEFSVQGGGNVSVGWTTTEPAVTQLLVSQPGGGIVKVAAPVGAVDRRYGMYVWDSKSGQVRRSNAIDIAIGTGGDSASSGAPPKVEKLSEQEAKHWGSRLGLSTDIKPSDKAFSDRVKKLENCAGIAPATGVTSTALQTYLAKRKQVNSAGDCPDPRTPSVAHAGALAGSGVAAGTQKSTAVPAPAPASSSSTKGLIPPPPHT